MATAKSKKAAVKQKKTAKSPVKKAAKAASEAKKSAKKSPARKVQLSKSLSGKPAKSAGAKKLTKAAATKTKAVKSTAAKGKKSPLKKTVKPAAKPSSKTSPVKKNSKPVVNAKTSKAVAVKDKSVKTSAKKQVSEKTKEKHLAIAVKETAGAPAKKTAGAPAKKTLKPEKGRDKELKVTPAKPTKSKKEQDAEGEEGPDPVQIKTDKLIKELEESMDLSKMKPRIQAGTTPKPLVKQAHPPLKLIEPTLTNKVKYQLEFEFRSSPKILFTALSDSSGLAGWFADEVKTKDDLYTFIWEGGESHAKLVAIRELQLVRFQWLDDTDGTYFQFEIKEDDITSDIALIITDFAFPGEKDTNIKLWEAQVQKLRMVLGSL